MAGNSSKQYVVKIVLCLLLIDTSNAKPTSSDKVTMSGEPTHFQVDDKAAELEINANAMGVKVNAKPASLQVVSKPGAPAMAVPHPAVFVPPVTYPVAPYYPGASIYPSPMVIGHRRTVRRRHHFFDANPSMGNWNFKKEQIPGNDKSSNKKGEPMKHEISKKLEISGKAEAPKNSKASQIESRKRMWIQQVPVLAQLVSYNPGPMRVHPLVQRFLASQAAMRDLVPRPVYALNQQTFLPWSQRSFYMLPGSVAVDGDLRNSIHRAIFLPALPGYQKMQAISPLIKAVNQPWPSANILQTPVTGYNGYYDPILTRDFIPDYSNEGLPRVQVPTPRAMIPNGLPDGLMYPGYTPLGQLQLLSKRLTIPHNSKAKQAKTMNPQKMYKSEKRKRNYQTRLSEDINPEKSNVEKANREKSKRRKRSAEEDKETIPHVKAYHGSKSTKRQFILTEPTTQPVQRPIVGYVPVITNIVDEPPPGNVLLTTPQNGLLNLPGKTPGTFVLNLPSELTNYALHPAVNTLLHSGQYNVLPEYQPNYVATATQRSGIVPRRAVPGPTLGELTGIMGKPIVRRGPRLTMFYNDQLPSNVQDEILRDSVLQGRAMIPGKRFLGRYVPHKQFGDGYATDYRMSDSDDETESYDTSPVPERIEKGGSFTETKLPDGRIVFRKDHLGFGPITVEANTAEPALHHNDDAIDMNLDSDKRKQIPRPENERVMDRRIRIPTPVKLTTQ